MSNAGQTPEEAEISAANAAFYAALSARSVDRIAASCAQDADVTCLHENSKAVAVGWAAVRESWDAVDFPSFSDLSVVMDRPTIGICGTMARVVGVEVVHGVKDGASFAFNAFGTNIFEKRGGRWLVVHHHASMAVAQLVA